MGPAADLLRTVESDIERSKSVHNMLEMYEPLQRQSLEKANREYNSSASFATSAQNAKELQQTISPRFPPTTCP